MYYDAESVWSSYAFGIFIAKSQLNHRFYPIFAHNILQFINKICSIIG